MGIIKRNKRDNTSKKEGNKKVNSYNNLYEVQPLKLICIIVNRYQGDYFLDLLIKKNNISAAFLCGGHGTATRDIYNLLNISENKKDVVIALIPERKLKDIFKQIENRFNISNNAKGLAFSLKADSVIGVLAYRFFTDTKENIKKEVNENE